MSQIVIIDGHPDPDPGRLCHALADAYADGARQAGHNVAQATLALLDFPLLSSADDWNAGRSLTPESLVDVQQRCIDADHFLIIYPLWLGTMPALLKGFLEQVFRPGVALTNESGGLPKPALRGKSARIVVTMGMPALAYRWYFRAHSLKSLERNVLKFAGVKPVRETLLGSVDSVSAEKRKRWLTDMRALGSQSR